MSEKEDILVIWERFIEPTLNSTISHHRDDLNQFLIKTIYDSRNEIQEYTKVLLNKSLNPNDSLFWFRITEYGISQPYWLVISICCGSYHQAIREMRFLLESWSQAYYIDQEYPKTTKDRLFIKLNTVGFLYGSIVNVSPSPRSFPKALIVVMRESLVSLPVIILRLDPCILNTGYLFDFIRLSGS